MISREQVIEKVREVVYECAPELEGTPLDENTVINTDTGIDSMGFTLIICRLEGVFDVRIPNRQWSKLETLGEVADAIMKRLPQEN
ncbi:MAG: acyl carrier protein [Lachnospiraceae bacterium]|nr:acyl carrier protein [Lachnospiraceae bacterium]